MLDWDMQRSRVVSGAMIEDELRAFALFGTSIFVVRSKTLGDDLTDDIDVPVINAGDSTEHPTQALIDLFTSFARGDVETLDALPAQKISMLVPRGSIARQVISLLGLLEQVPQVHTTVICEDYFSCEYKTDRVLLIEPADINALSEALSGSSYIVALPSYESERLIGCTGYSLTPELLKFCAPDARLLHPFPRTTRELPRTFDYTSFNAYWDQMRHSIPVRCATLAWSLGLC
jgi:aspartate carbamoyltransferase catalytic subunit